MRAFTRYAFLLLTMLLLAGPALAGEDAPLPPEAPRAQETPAPAPPTSPEAKPGGAAEDERPADAPESAPAGVRPAPPAGPALAVQRIGDLEILPRNYDETLAFYVSVLGFQEESAAGAEGERRRTLACGPVRLRLREQPVRAAAPQRPSWLGVYPVPLSDVAAEQAGMREPEGVVVDDVVPQGPAAAAGLLKGDIIVAVEGKKTDTPEALIAAVRSLPVGKKALVTLWRERKKQDVPVALPASPFPDRLAPVSIRLEVRDLDAFYREVLRRGLKVYAEPRDTPEGARILELIDPNDVLVVLEQPAAGSAPPGPGGGTPQPPPPPSPGDDTPQPPPPPSTDGDTPPPPPPAATA
ncbi:MAG: PDZ domain-containing protein [Armatimonadetes bacterium]|nr:PDZ domain-containing protein [Armatimonadota bacterium]